MSHSRASKARAILGRTSVSGLLLLALLAPGTSLGTGPDAEPKPSEDSPASASGSHLARTSLTDRSSTEFSSYLAHIAAAGASLRLQEFDEARRWLSGAPSQHRGWEWKHLMSRLDHSLFRIDAHDRPVEQIAFSPDGRWMATADAGGEFAIWDAATGVERARFVEHTGAIEMLQFSPDGSRLLTGSVDGTARLWNLLELAPDRVLHEGPLPVRAGSFSAGGENVVLFLAEPYGPTSRPTEVVVYDLGSGEPLVVREREGRSIRAVAVHPSGRELVTSSGDFGVLHWTLGEDEPDPRELSFDPAGSVSIRYLCYSADGEKLAATARDRRTKVWDRDGREIAVLQGHTDEVVQVVFHPKRDVIVTGSQDRTARVWDLQTGKCVSVLRGQDSPIRAVAYHPEGRQLVTGGEDGSVHFWDPLGRTELASGWRHDPSAYAAPFSPDGRFVASCGYDGTIRLWNAVSGEQIAIFRGHTDSANTLAFTPDGRRLVSGSNDRTLRVWSLETFQCERVLSGHEQGIPSLAIHPEGSELASASFDGTVRIWSLETGEELNRFEDLAASAVAYSPDGASLVAAGSGGQIQVRDSETDQITAALDSHTDYVHALAFASDGSLLLSAGADGEVCVWDVSSRTCVRHLTGHQDGVNAVAFFPDGSRILTGSADNTLRLWDTDSGRHILTLDRFDSPVYAVSVSTDGDRISVCPLDGSVRIHDASPLGRRVREEVQFEQMKEDADNWIEVLLTAGLARSEIGQMLTEDETLSEAFRWTIRERLLCHGTTGP